MKRKAKEMRNPAAPSIIFTLLGAGCGAPPPEQPVDPPSIACARLVLRPGVSNFLDYGAGTREPISIAVSTERVPDATEVVVRASACRGGPDTTYLHPGSEPFTLDDSWVATVTSRGCTEISAIATRHGVNASVDTLRLRRGEASVAGRTSPPAPGLRVEIGIDADRFHTVTGADGTYSLTHLPPGWLSDVRGIKTKIGKPPPAKALAVGASTVVNVDYHENPNVQLADAVVEVNLVGKSEPAALDLFEPDDSVAEAATRSQKLKVNGGEAHTLTSWRDVDVIPIQIVGSGAFRISYLPVAGVKARPKLTLLAQNGSVLKVVNGDPATAVENPTISTPSAPLPFPRNYYVRIERADNVSQACAYNLALTKDVSR